MNHSISFASTKESLDQYTTREDALRAVREGDRILKVLDMNGGRFAFVGYVDG